MKKFFVYLLSVVLILESINIPAFAGMMENIQNNQITKEAFELDLLEDCDVAIPDTEPILAPINLNNCTIKVVDVVKNTFDDSTSEIEVNTLSAEHDVLVLRSLLTKEKLSYPGIYLKEVYFTNEDETIIENVRDYDKDIYGDNYSHTFTDMSGTLTFLYYYYDDGQIEDEKEPEEDTENESIICNLDVTYNEVNIDEKEMQVIETLNVDSEYLSVDEGYEYTLNVPDNMTGYLIRLTMNEETEEIRVPEGFTEDKFIITKDTKIEVFYGNKARVCSEYDYFYDYDDNLINKIDNGKTCKILGSKINLDYQSEKTFEDEIFTISHYLVNGSEVTESSIEVDDVMEIIAVYKPKKKMHEVIVTANDIDIDERTMTIIKTYDTTSFSEKIEEGKKYVFNAPDDTLIYRVKNVQGDKTDETDFKEGVSLYEIVIKEDTKLEVYFGKKVRPVCVYEKYLSKDDKEDGEIKLSEDYLVLSDEVTISNATSKTYNDKEYKFSHFVINDKKQDDNKVVVTDELNVYIVYKIEEVIKYDLEVTSKDVEIDERTMTVKKTADSQSNTLSVEDSYKYTFDAPSNKMIYQVIVTKGNKSETLDYPEGLKTYEEEIKEDTKIEIFYGIRVRDFNVYFKLADEKGNPIKIAERDKNSFELGTTVTITYDAALKYDGYLYKYKNIIAGDKEVNSQSINVSDDMNVYIVYERQAKKVNLTITKKLVEIDETTMEVFDTRQNVTNSYNVDEGYNYVFKAGNGFPVYKVIVKTQQGEKELKYPEGSSIFERTINADTSIEVLYGRRVRKVKVSVELQDNNGYAVKSWEENSFTSEVGLTKKITYDSIIKSDGYVYNINKLRVNGKDQKSSEVKVTENMDIVLVYIREKSGVSQESANRKTPKAEIPKTNNQTSKTQTSKTQIASTKEVQTSITQSPKVQTQKNDTSKTQSQIQSQAKVNSKTNTSSEKKDNEKKEVTSVTSASLKSNDKNVATDKKDEKAENVEDDKENNDSAVSKESKVTSESKITSEEKDKKDKEDSNTSNDSKETKVESSKEKTNTEEKLEKSDEKNNNKEKQNTENAKTPSSEKEKNKKIDGGDIAGGILGVMLLCIFIYVFICIKNENRNKEKFDDLEDSDDTDEYDEYDEEEVSEDADEEDEDDFDI